MKKAIILTSILFAVIFITSQNSFAQGCISLLGVNNCGSQGQNTQRTTTNTPSTVTQNGTKFERFLLNPNLSADVIKSTQSGARYLLLLKRYNAPNNPGCVIEDRAWVSQIEANNGTQITVKIGSPRTVLVCTQNNSIENVNNAERSLAYYRNQISLWQKEQQRLAQYFNNPTYSASARQEYQKAQGYINTYVNYINTLQNGIAQVAP